QWAPYNSKTMCILDILDNLPRLRISDTMMKLFIWALKECGVNDTPSFYALRKVQKNLCKKQGIPSMECKSGQGKIFFVNDIREIIKHDWANPLVRSHIHVYPEIPEDGIIREVWHAEKWRKDMDLDILSPMYDAKNGRHFYVFEISRLRDGQLVIPIRWIIAEKQVCADAFKVHLDSEGVAHVDDSQSVLIRSKDLDANYLDLEHSDALPTTWSDDAIAAGHPARMPNHYRKIAQNDPIYMSFIDYFGDDVSGNRSKSWNKHNNSYITHRNLPRKLLQQEYHVHLVSTSQHATITEQYHEVKKIIDSTHKEPVCVEDTNGLTTRFMLRTHAGASDNPAQSDIASHIGSKGNHPCRKCKAGGTETSKCTDEGFHSMCNVGNPRNKTTTLNELEEQVKLACYGVAKPIQERQTNSGTKDAFTQYWIEDLLKRSKEEKRSNPRPKPSEIQKKLLTWVSENRNKIYSSFLTTEGFDPARDTPVEILHTILLGVVKYIWTYSHTKWKDTEKTLYAHRLQATDTNGLSINAIRSQYIIDYANSLIGRQFKTIIQTAIFQLYDLVDEDHFKAWKAIAQLSALLWHVEIDDMDQYCKDVDTAAANVQDAFALIDPTKIIRKIKLHLLSHLSEDICAFGSLVGVATEVFESFNAVFRFCSVLSNHQAPSRDIARQLGDQESLKHRETWFDDTANEWTQSGASVRSMMKDHRFLQNMLGWSVPVGQNKVKQEVKLNETLGKRAINKDDFDSGCIWIKGKAVIAASADECRVGSWVFYRSPVHNKTVIGRIQDILSNGTTHIAILQEFEVSSQKDPFFDLPYVFRRQDEVSYVIMPSINILFIQNVQHDCRTAKCTASGTRIRMQERVKSDQTESFIEHKPVDRFLINLCAFHNSHLIRRILPRELTAPIPLFADRRREHNRCAEVLRHVVGKRKEQTKKKQEETARQKASDDEEAEGSDLNDTSIELPPQPKKRKRGPQAAGRG
ncbi:hypothetical protein K435DRAFT_670511, partial [Dendrothele bispora CBS 962.96]